MWKRNKRLQQLLCSVALALCLSGCGPAADSDEAVHFTQAHMLSVAVPEGTNFEPPPQDMNESSLPETGWQDVILPHKVSGNKKALPANPNLLNWYRLNVAGSSANEPRYLYLPSSRIKSGRLKPL